MIKEYNNVVLKQYLDSTAPKSMLLGNQLLTMKPDLGYFITVNGLEIPQKFFKQEFDAVNAAYKSFLQKLQEYYLDKNPNFFVNLNSLNKQVEFLEKEQQEVEKLLTDIKKDNND